MLNRFIARAMTPALALALIACAAPDRKRPLRFAPKDRQITDTTIASNHHAGIGALVGGLTGLGIGSLIGAGTGRDVAMVAGAVGGALAGNEVQKKNDQPVPAQQIIVRTNSGVLVAVTQPPGPPLYVGQRVYIQGNGEGARVTPQQ
jgi:outer membrane lipoprotein SlyB